METEIKTLQQGLGFIKRGYNSIEAATAASTGNGKGKVVFDTTHKIICVDGVAFGGNITDATFTNSVLTITKTTGDPVEIDFSDIASASSMMNVFQQFADIIGITGSGSGMGIDYTDTNYLSELGQQGKLAKNLVNADKALDAKIKEVNDAIAEMDGTAGIASESNGIVTIKSGVTQSDGTISNDSGNDITLAKVAVTGAAADVSVADTNNHFTSENVEGALTELALAVEALQGAFDVVVSTDAAHTPQGVKWGSPEVTGELVASANTFHKIYLVPAGGTTPNTYSEYITTRTGAEGSYVYGWEKLGDIAVDLTGYVKTVTVNGKVYAVDSNSTNISLGNVITAVTGETAIAGGNSDYVAVTATPTTEATTGENSIALTSTVKTHAVGTATDSDDGLATAKNVKDYVDTKSAVVNSNPTIIANDTTAAQIGTVGGTALTAKVALFWDEWESGSGE